jgi:hypothetical protein
MLRSVAIKVSVCCPECTSQVPLNGLHTHASCPTCRFAFDVVDDLAWWEQEEVHGCLGAVLDAATPEELPYDAYADEAQLVFLRQDPPCPGCGRPIPAAELAGSLERGATTCACGGSLPLRPVDDALREATPWLRGLAGEAPAAVIQQRPGQAIAITCPACGGELALVAGQRTARCAYCGTSSVTPDPGAPARQREWFYLLLDPDEKMAVHWSLLARDAEEVEELAADPSTPPLQLEVLATFGWHLRPVAANPSTPPGALLLLASAEDDSEREEVAKNRSAPREALALLAADEEEDIRKAVAARSDLPPDVLARLARDSSEYVRHVIAGKRDLPEELLLCLAADTDHEIPRTVARSSGVTPAVLDVLAASSDTDVLEHVARHKLTRPETLAKLADNTDGSIRERVAANHATPPEVLARLATVSEDVASWVNDAARKNPSCPRSWRRLF